MKLSGNWYWPDYDVRAEPAILVQADDLPRYLAHVPNQGICVQAGGNVGVFPEILSRHFSQIYTFEPDPRNWECLSANVKAGNVIRFNAGLSDQADTATMFVPPGEEQNCGAVMVRKGGIIPLMTVDGLNLPGLDLLMLDIEGFEYPALVGALDAISKFKPVVSLELKGLGERMGYDDQMCVDFLTQRGYRQIDEIGRDKVFAC